MTPLTASIEMAGPYSVLHCTVLSSLPNSYRLVEGPADVVLVSATEPAAAERAVGGGARAVFIDQPGRLSLPELVVLEDLADQSGCIVVPAPRYGPRLAVSPDLLDGTPIELVESTVTSRDSPRSSLVEQLALVRRVLGVAMSIRVLHSSGSHYVVEATMADHPDSHVLLNGVASPAGAEEATLQTVGVEQHLVVRIDAGPLARPPDISLFDGGGRQSPWPVHQHAHRITLGLLHTLLTAGEGSLTYSVADLRHDLRLAAVLAD